MRESATLLRRWDRAPGSSPNQSGFALDGTTFVRKAGAEGAWVDLESGIQVQLGGGGEFRSGDYWLIPARVATGDVRWPRDDSGPMARPPRGVEHHYAPLAVVTAPNKFTDCRCVIGNPVICP
jgi:hypothetical protein